MEPEQRQNLAIEAGRAFSPAAPIDERALFAGRDKQVRLVIDAINQKGQHAIIYGERGVGKTSLSNVLSAFLGGPASNVVAPRVNCDATDTFDSVWRKVFDEVELLRQTRTLRFHDAVDYSSFKSTELLGDGLATPDSVRRVLTIMAQGALPIVIVDEFDRLAEDQRRAFADTVKTLSDHAVSATVLLVGVAESVDQLVQEHQSIERALVQIRMPRMSNSEIERILTTGVDRLGMTIEADAMRRITVLAQGLPHYAHLVGLYAARTAIDADSLSITVDVVNQAISSAVSGAHESISNAWHNATRSPRKDNLFADVLLSCALAPTDQQGTFAAQDVRGPMRTITSKPYEIPSFAQHLNEFCDAKRGPILRRTGTKRRYRYAFVNPLLQPFVVMQGFTSGKISEEALRNLGADSSELERREERRR
jgi:Cdc6-like AAA superfamily ATPase